MPEKLLIVDDELDLLVLLNRLVRDYTSYEAVCTSNPWEALDLIGQGGFGLVIAGMKLEGLDGGEFLTKCKRINGNIPVILVSAYGTVETALEIMQKGGFEFIMKPFRKEQMLFAIENAFAWARLKEENRILRERSRPCGQAKAARKEPLLDGVSR
jgi:DNA-binding NtrC family response regulator